jgi:hypothetical protein
MKSMAVAATPAQLPSRSRPTARLAVLYLFLLFAALLASSTNRSTTALSARAATTVETSQAAFPASQFQTTHGPFQVSAGGGV